MRTLSFPSLLAASLLVTLACKSDQKPDQKPTDSTKTGDQGGQAAAKPTAAEAKAFVDGVDARLRELWTAESKAAWTHATDITDEHAAAVAAASEQSMAYIGQAIKE